MSIAGRWCWANRGSGCASRPRYCLLHTSIHSYSNTMNIEFVILAVAAAPDQFLMKSEPKSRAKEKFGHNSRCCRSPARTRSGCANTACSTNRCSVQLFHTSCRNESSNRTASPTFQARSSPATRRLVHLSPSCSQNKNDRFTHDAGAERSQLFTSHDYCTK